MPDGVPEEVGEGVGDGVADGVAEGVGDGVAEGVAEGEGSDLLHTPEESGDCRIVRCSMFASLSMKTVIPPSEELPHEGDDAVWSAHFLNGVAQPSRSIFVVTEVMSDWHTIWTGCPSTVWIVRFCQACQLTVICLVVPTGARLGRA